MHNLTLTALITGFQQTEMNLIALVTTVVVVLISFALSSASQKNKETLVRKRIEAEAAKANAAEAKAKANDICLANLNALMLNLGALHKARIVRNETKKRYNDNRRNTELISALHKADVNYKQAKDNLSSYLIEATQA